MSEILFFPSSSYFSKIDRDRGHGQTRQGNLRLAPLLVDVVAGRILFIAAVSAAD